MDAFAADNDVVAANVVIEPGERDFLQAVRNFLNKQSNITLFHLELNPIHGRENYDGIWSRFLTSIEKIDRNSVSRRPFPGALARGAMQSVRFEHWKFPGVPFIMEGFQNRDGFSIQITIKSFQALDPAQQQLMLLGAQGGQSARQAIEPLLAEINAHQNLSLNPQLVFGGYHTQNTVVMNAMFNLMYPDYQRRLDTVFDNALADFNNEDEAEGGFDASKGFFFYNLNPLKTQKFYRFLRGELQTGHNIIVRQREDEIYMPGVPNIVTLTVRMQKRAPRDQDDAEVIVFDVTFHQTGDWIQVHGIGFDNADVYAFDTQSIHHSFNNRDHLNSDLKYFKYKLRKLKDYLNAPNRRFVDN